MTSNPNFADYVERVQESLAVFSLTDSKAKQYLMESKPLATYKPRFIEFEILFNDIDNQGVLERKFYPHVSDKLIAQAPHSTCLDDLKRLYRNAERMGIELETEDWRLPKHVRDDEYLSKHTRDSLDKLLDPQGVLSELRNLYESLKEYEIPPGKNPEKKIETKLERVKELLNYLVQWYEVQYIPTNVGSTALVYEAWKQGKLIPLGNPEHDQDKFNELLSGLFIDSSSKDYKTLMCEMAQRLGLSNPGICNINQDKLSDDRIWVGTPEGWKLFSFLETSLIHKIDQEDESNKVKHRYLIYYPLMIDDYWFAGVA
ncbi:MAG: hypothetical protein AAGG51_01075, partial [Cyanobacteria bacterium P01_G01_bin.54]